MNELKNMIITNVTKCSDHAKSRIGRTLRSIIICDDGTVQMMYPKTADGKQPFFRLTNVIVKRKLFSKKNRIIFRHWRLYAKTGNGRGNLKC